MNISVHSNIGRLRSSNQDYAEYFLSQQNQPLFVLCDGVGGHQAGEVASRLTTQYLGERFERLDMKLRPAGMKIWMKNAIEDVNNYIYAKSKEDPSREGMSTTLVMGSIIDGEIIIAHVGDSRAYLYHDDTLTQLTRDHSLVNELIRTGEITEQEGEIHPQRNIVTQSIGGTSDVKSEMNTFKCEEEDVLMLCSDGLTNMVRKEELITFFKKHCHDDNLGELLIQAANEAGGTDNITVIIVSNLLNESQGKEAVHHG